MFNSKIPSPARSLGGKSTPRRHKRLTRSVCSPARSDNSVKLTALIPDNFVVSPLPKRRSVLTDDTDIDMPRRQSWWKKLSENSRDVMELLEHRDVPEGNMMIEENFDVEIISQEKKNYTADLLESSDCESINSIVIPQRKLFTHKENNPPKKFTHVMNNREELAKLQKSHVDHVNEIDVRPKSLFNQAKKTKPKPIFPPALLNMSTNKSIANKTELPVVESKGQARNLFGNRPGTKRKNMFADFIVSESEDEIPEIKPKVFGFQKKHEVKQRMSHAAHGLLNSPTTSIIDIDMDDWKHLPSSTMVENQIEEQEATPSKRIRLSKLLESKNMENVSVNKTKNNSKLTNASIEPTNRSKQFSSPTTNNQFVNISKKQRTDEANTNTSVQPNQPRNNANSCKNMKSFIVEEHTAKLQQNDVNDKEKGNHDEIEKDDEHMISDNNKINNVQDKQETFSKSPHESDAEDDFTLEYENEEDNIVHNEKSFRNNLNDVPNEVFDESKNEEAHKTLVIKEISQGKNKEDINVTETMKPKNLTVEEDDRNDKTTKNKSYEVSKNSEVQNDENNFNNEDSKQAKYVSESTISQEIQDEESGDENDGEENEDEGGINDDESEENDDEGEKNYDESEENDVNGEKTDDESEENDDEESENEKIEEISAREDEKNENIHEIINKDSSNEEKINKELDYQNQIDVADNNEQIEYRKIDMSNKEININSSTKITHTTSSTPDNKKNNVTNECPPEAILFQESNNLIESFTRKEHNSPRKTKSMTRHPLKPSLAPVRESTGFSDNTGNSSANSGWDSHRTTRKTLRKTFGKDFTPRKSLRTLVMEKAARYQSLNPDIGDIDQHPNTDSTELFTDEGKSAKRETFNPDLRDISKHPNANSTELIAHEVKLVKRQTFNPDLHDISKHPNANSTELIAHEVKLVKRQTFNPDLHDISKHPNANSTELLAQEQRSANRQSLNPDLHVISKHTHTNSTELPACDVNEPFKQSDVDTVEKNQTDLEEGDQNINKTMEYAENRSVEKNNSELDESEHDDNESTHEAGSDEEKNQEMEDDNQDNNETTGQSEAESVEEKSNNTELDESEYDDNESTHEVGSDEEKNQEMEDDNQDNNETTGQSDVESVEENSKEIDDKDDNNETAEHTEDEPVEENPEEIDDDNNDDNNDTTEHTEVESVEEIEDDDNNETTQHTEAESVEDNPEEIDDVDNNETTNQTEAEDEDNQEEIEESDLGDHAEMEESDDYANENTEQSEGGIIETNHTETEETVEKNDHELSERMRQTTLETYIQKIRQERLDREKKIREDIMNTLKVSTNRNCFKLPYMMPIHRASKPVQKAKPKVSKTTPLFVVPEEILEDMKYKPPKRFQPRNASWATKRLYKYLESKLEPKYSYMCRVRAEKLVGTIYEFTRQLRRHEVAPPAAVDALKLEMARLKVVDTHYEFYLFFHEYMPREIRVKVNPDPVNKIQTPKDVFANIIQ